MRPDAKPKVLGSDSALVEDAPYWENETPLYLESDRYGLEFISNRLNEFPLIEDFEVILSDTENATFGYHIYFFSRNRGYIAGFAWWDHAEADLLRENFRIPLGDFQHAFSDVEQSWNISIAAQDNFVYVVQGNDEYLTEGFYAWFKVEKDRYLAAWQKTIDLCRATFSAEDIHYFDFHQKFKQPIMDGKSRSLLVKRITKVFANVPLPGKTEADIGNYREVGRFIGKKWQQLTLADINSDTSLKYFRPKTIQYYLPAYLKFLLLEPDQVNSMTRDTLLDVLTPNSPDWKVQHIKVDIPFSSKQKEVIRLFVEGYEELFPFEDKNDARRELLQRAIEYWQST